MNGDVLSMVKSADVVEKKDKKRSEVLLQQALYLCEWLEREDEASRIIHQLNKLQILKRMRELSEEEMSWLRNLLEDAAINNSLKLGASALLGNAEEFDIKHRCRKRI